MNEPMKLPLKITDDNRAGNIYLGTDDNKHMILVISQLPGREPAKAIAEYIVVVCNSHKGLMKVCEAIVSFCESKERLNDDGICPTKAYELAKQEIEKAKPK